MSKLDLPLKKIDCLHLRQVNGVRWLGVFARDDLPNVTREKRPWYRIPNTDPKCIPGTHWLALYKPQSGRIEFFNSFSYFFSIYGLDLLDHFYLFYFFIHLVLLYVDTTVLFISIFVLVRHHNITFIICIYISQIATYWLHSIFIILNPVLYFQSLLPYKSMLSI